MSSQTEIEKVKSHLISLMQASKSVIDVRNSTKSNHVMEAAIEKLQHEFIQCAILMKTLDNNPKIPALLNPNHGVLLDRQMFSFKESLSVDMSE